MTLRQLHFVPPVLLLVAQAHDLLSESGVMLDARRTTSSGEQRDALLSGDTDIVVTAMDNAIVWNAQGADVRIVGQVERSTLLSVYASAGTRTLADLEGARFAVDAASNGFSIIAKWMLARAGVTADLVEVGGVKERADALLAGSVDATLLGPPFDTIVDDAGMARIAAVDTVLPSYPGQGILARARRSEHEDEALRAYLRALTAAVAVADSMELSEGIDLLVRSGVPAPSAEALWTARPSSLRVERQGLAMVESIRSELGLLPDGHRALVDLIDASTLDPQSATGARAEIEDTR